jgi:hypothetical protein
MIHTDEVKIMDIALHKIGSKAAEEGVKFSKKAIRVDENISDILMHYFLGPFKSNEYYHLSHDTDINMNEIFSYVSNIMKNPTTLYEQSVNIAKHLYQKSSHPKIKAGELCVAFFKDIVVEGELTDAVGIFKSENKDTFIKIYTKDDDFGIDSDSGININKLDKGCLIFNTLREQGFLVSVVDSLSKTNEARYWIDEFLHLKRREDEYYYTENVITMCKNFVEDVITEEFQVTKADQSEILNSSLHFLKENEEFNVEEFEQEVIRQPDMIDSWRSFKDRYENEKGMEPLESFPISNPAVKKQAKLLKSVIKLDKNFQIYITGDSSMMERGVDENNGRKYYKMYYFEEF